MRAVSKQKARSNHTKTNLELDAIEASRGSARSPRALRYVKRLYRDRLAARKTRFGGPRSPPDPSRLPRLPTRPLPLRSDRGDVIVGWTPLLRNAIENVPRGFERFSHGHRDRGGERPYDEDRGLDREHRVEANFSQGQEE